MVELKTFFSDPYFSHLSPFLVKYLFTCIKNAVDIGVLTCKEKEAQMFLSDIAKVKPDKNYDYTKSILRVIENYF